MEMEINIMIFISIIITVISVISFYTPWVWKLKDAEMWIYTPVISSWAATGLIKIFSIMLIE